MSKKPITIIINNIINEKVICSRCKGSKKEYNVMRQEEIECHICDGKGYVDERS